MKKLLLAASAALMLFTACGEKGGEKETKSAVTYPEKPMELVVPYSAGGGSDRNGRTIADIIQKNNFASQPLMVVNKPGGSGAVGNAYTNSKKGSDYTLMTMVGGQAASAIYNNAQVTVDMFTPIAVLAYDAMLLGVTKDAKYSSLEEAVAAAKAAPESVVVGGPNIGNEEFYAYKLLEKNTGAKFKYVSFNGTGDVISAMLGGHIDVGILKPAAAMSQVEAGNINPIVTYTEDRLEGAYADAPTFEELGYPKTSVKVYRAIVGAPDMSEEAVAYWETALKKVSETSEWQDGYIKKNLLVPNFMGSKEAKEFMLADQERFREMFEALD